MVGKTTYREMITPEEAMKLHEILTVKELNIVMGIYQTLAKEKPIKGKWDFCWLLSLVYFTGRVQGIREERAKKKTNKHQISTKTRGF